MLTAPLNHGDGEIPALADRMLGACDQIHAAVIGGWRGGWETT
jgi:hypothetical protein